MERPLSQPVWKWALRKRALRKWPHRKLVRIVLAGPVAVLVALVVLAGMPLWLPGGAAGIDNLIVPLVLAPLIWAALFFHACLDGSLRRVALVAAALFVLHGGLVAQRFFAPAPATEKAG